MRGRCLIATHPKFPSYGGRGIKVCDRWLNNYAAFLADVGRAPTPGHSLDRVENNGDYEPGNVRWATASVQQSNRRRYRLDPAKPHHRFTSEEAITAGRKGGLARAGRLPGVERPSPLAAVLAIFGGAFDRAVRR